MLQIHHVRFQLLKPIITYVYRNTVYGTMHHVHDQSYYSSSTPISLCIFSLSIDTLPIHIDLLLLKLFLRLLPLKNLLPAPKSTCQCHIYQRRLDEYRSTVHHLYKNIYLTIYNLYISFLSKITINTRLDINDCRIFYICLTRFVPSKIVCSKK